MHSHTHNLIPFKRHNNTNPAIVSGARGKDSQSQILNHISAHFSGIRKIVLAAVAARPLPLTAALSSLPLPLKNSKRKVVLHLWLSSVAPRFLPRLIPYYSYAAFCGVQRPKFPQDATQSGRRAAPKRLPRGQRKAKAKGGNPESRWVNICALCQYVKRFYGSCGLRFGNKHGILIGRAPPFKERTIPIA